MPPPPRNSFGAQLVSSQNRRKRTHMVHSTEHLSMSPTLGAEGSHQERVSSPRGSAPSQKCPQEKIFRAQLGPPFSDHPLRRGRKKKI